MRNDVECPYCGCGAGLEVDYSDGQGVEECVIYEKDCDKCEKTFLYDTAISFSHRVWKAPCQNSGEHDWEFVRRHPRERSWMKCAVCGDTRELTEKEREEYDVCATEYWEPPGGQGTVFKSVTRQDGSHLPPIKEVYGVK